jgi:hypothetical protein
MFGHFLPTESFNNQKKLLAYKQASFPITFSAIKFILTTTIITYYRNWAFLASFIVAKFMVNQCPFLLEALTWVNNNTFLF